MKWIALALLAWATHAQALSDDLGREVAPVGPGRRVASLSPFLTEIAFAAGAGADLVAASEYSDYPAQATRLPPVANAYGISWEKLAALRPALVLAWKDGVRDGDIARLESLGSKVFVFSGRRMDDVPRALRAVAALTGREDPPAAAAFESRVAALARAHASGPRLRVFFEVSHKPLMTIAGAHFVNDALAACGAENAFADLAGVAPEVSWESLLARDPQAIVGTGAAGREDAFLRAWRERGTLSAVRSGALVYVDADLLLRPTPRLAEGVASLCRGLDKVRSRQ